MSPAPRAMKRAMDVRRPATTIPFSLRQEGDVDRHDVTTRELPWMPDAPRRNAGGNRREDWQHPRLRPGGGSMAKNW
jgi:hypothetical protein